MFSELLYLHVNSVLLKKLNVILFICFFSFIYSQEKIEHTPKKSRFSLFSVFKDSLKRYNHFELSFGQNLLFISQSKQDIAYNTESIIIPTSSILFFSEFRPQKTLRIPVFLNIATESKQYLVDKVIVNEKASPTIGTGLVFKIFEYRLDPKSRIELELGTLASFILDTKRNIRIAPVFAARFKICRGENFVMYVGANYSLGVDAIGLMYGTGTVF